MDNDKSGGIADLFLHNLPKAFVSTLRADAQAYPALDRNVDLYVTLLEKYMLKFKVHASNKKTVEAQSLGLSQVLSLAHGRAPQSLALNRMDDNFLVTMNEQLDNLFLGQRVPAGASSVAAVDSSPKAAPQQMCFKQTLHGDCPDKYCRRSHLDADMDAGTHQILVKFSHCAHNKSGIRIGKLSDLPDGGASIVTDPSYRGPAVTDHTRPTPAQYVLPSRDPTSTPAHYAVSSSAPMPTPLPSQSDIVPPGPRAPTITPADSPDGPPFRILQRNPEDRQYSHPSRCPKAMMLTSVEGMPPPPPDSSLCRKGPAPSVCSISTLTPQREADIYYNLRLDPKAGQFKKSGNIVNDKFEPIVAVKVVLLDSGDDWINFIKPEFVQRHASVLTPFRFERPGSVRIADGKRVRFTEHYKLCVELCDMAGTPYNAVLTFAVLPGMLPDMIISLPAFSVYFLKIAHELLDHAHVKYSAQETNLYFVEYDDQRSERVHVSYLCHCEADPPHPPPALFPPPTHMFDQPDTDDNP